MAQTKAYELRAQFKESFNGATVGYGNERHTFSVGEALSAGDGKIVTDESLLQAALECLDGGDGPLLKTTAIGDNPTYAKLPEGSVGAVESGVLERSQSELAAQETPDVPEKAEAEPEDGEAAQHSADSEYDNLTHDEVKQELRVRKIQFRGNASKEELIRLLEDDDDAQR